MKILSCSFALLATMLLRTNAIRRNNIKELPSFTAFKYRGILSGIRVAHQSAPLRLSSCSIGKPLFYFCSRNLMAPHVLPHFRTISTSINVGVDPQNEILPLEHSDDYQECKNSTSSHMDFAGDAMSSSLSDPSTFPAWSYEPRDFFRFEILYESKRSLARVGRIHTPHGVIDTPGYVAVATNGALKGVDFRDADACGQQLIFCNTYHLLLQPGTDIVRNAGGLHKFINRKHRPLITDSGGFQVFSLAYGSVYEELNSGSAKVNNPKRSGASESTQDEPSSKSDPKGGELKRARANSKHRNKNAVRVTENGVLFRSYRDGRKFLLTPESTVQAQKSLGADIIIPLDELPPYHIDRASLVRSVDRTHRWETRSLNEHLKDVRNQALYCVIHGGLDKELRKQSLDYLTSLPFDGYAIGGSLGKDGNELMGLLEWMMPLLNQEDNNDSNRHQNHSRRTKPRHLLGIADEPSILGAIRNGIDTMDSCYPTRLARHGTLLSRSGKIHIKSGKYSQQFGIPIDSECECSTCKTFDRAYLWHLVKAKEPVFIQLATIHNIQYMNDLMKRQRQLILDGEI